MEKKETTNETKIYESTYKEEILNGAYPKLSDSLIAVTIEDDGTVKKVDTSTEWYSYEEKRWANAVILKDESKSYNNGEVIPAFIAFNTTGMWIGKFETGYSGATSTSEAESNKADVSKAIVKPNVYSWRGIQVANAFTVSYNYKRELESHMMKNTEWGAVAYLSHSIYGINDEVRLNNNSDYLTGYAATTEN